MSAPGLAEWVFLAVLALLIFGPDKLPGLARGLGRTIASFKREASGAMDELRRAADVEDVRRVGRDLESVRDELRAVGRPQRGPRRARAAAAVPSAEEGSGHERAEAGRLPPPFDPDST